MWNCDVSDHAVHVCHSTQHLIPEASKARDTLSSHHVSSCDVTRAVGMWEGFNIEFYGADSHFCHSAYVTWSNMELWSAHMPARRSYFCCHTHILWDLTYMSSALQTLSVVCRNGGNAYWMQQSGETPDKEVEIKNVMFMLAATLKPVGLQCYLPRLPGAISSHDITWHDGMRVCHLTWRVLTWHEDSVSSA